MLTCWAARRLLFDRAISNQQSSFRALPDGIGMQPQQLNALHKKTLPHFRDNNWLRNILKRFRHTLGISRGLTSCRSIAFDVIITHKVIKVTPHYQPTETLFKENPALARHNLLTTLMKMKFTL